MNLLDQFGGQIHSPATRAAFISPDRAALEPFTASEHHTSDQAPDGDSLTACGSFLSVAHEAS